MTTHLERICNYLNGTNTIDIYTAIERYEDTYEINLTDEEVAEIENNIYHHIDICTNCGWWMPTYELTADCHELRCQDCTED